MTPADTAAAAPRTRMPASVPRSRQMVFAMTGARGLCGGIAASNLNVLHALGELSNETGTKLSVLSLLEKQSHRPDFLQQEVPFSAFQGDKWRFTAALLSATRHRPLVCFDHVTLALPLLPLAAAGIVRTVIFTHGSESWRRVRRTSRWSFVCASLCLANSPFTLEKMRQYLPPFRGAACLLGLSPDFAPNGTPACRGEEPIELEASDGQVRNLRGRVLLLVARMDAREQEKGHRQLIEVLPETLHDFPDLQLVFPGPGDDRGALQALARRRGVAAAVFAPGPVSQPVIEALYRKCYAFVMPSTQEGFGLGYLEAMYAAKPCIGCVNQGAEDVIVDSETGLLINDPNDRRELAGAIRTLLHDPARAHTMGVKGLERLRSRFTARHYQNRIKRRIAQVL